jgi:membrane protease subunit HflK
MDQFRPKGDNDPVQEIRKGVEDFQSLMNRFFSGRGLWPILIILALLYLGSGFYKVGPGEKGVELLFGKLYKVAEPGLKYRLPWPFMSHQIVDVSKVRRAEIGFRSGPGGRTRPVPQESLMLTGDENILDVQLFVQYMINDPELFLFGASDPESILKSSTEVAIRGIVGENTLDATMTKGRMEIQDKIKKYLQNLLDRYHTGLLVTQARLAVVEPPAEVKEAFNDVVRAWEDRERLIREAEGYREDILPKARGKADEMMRKAEAYMEQKVRRAEGDTNRFLSMLREYKKAPNITRERLHLESVEKFMPGANKIIIDGGTARVVPLLPLKGALGITNGSARQSAPATEDGQSGSGK